MTNERAIVIINENHTLLPDQERLLNVTFSKGWEKYPVPSTGWTFSEIENVHLELQDRSVKERNGLVVVFLSPVPALIKLCTISMCLLDEPIAVAIFHNDIRDAKELPNGQIIHTFASHGWQLV